MAKQRRNQSVLTDKNQTKVDIVKPPVRYGYFLVNRKPVQLIK